MAIIKQYTIKQEDVGKVESDYYIALCSCCGAEKLEFVFEPLGMIQAQDVGKICRKVGEVWQAENEEQFKARIQQRTNTLRSIFGDRVRNDL